MTSTPSIKILVGYHKPAQIIKSDILVPIHLGRSVATEMSKDGTISRDDYQWMQEHLIGDDTGDNISHLNRRYCELTAIYWAWKNYDKLGNPDYIGFCHYRRYFDFLEEVSPRKTDRGMVLEPFIPAILRKTYEENARAIADRVSQSDIVHTPLLKYTRTVYEQFKEFESPSIGLKYSIFQDVFKDIPARFPSFNLGAQMYAAAKQQYCYNCFVMKREHFFAYCDFVFPLLFAAEKRINYQELNLNGQRILAYIAERLTGVFITQKEIEKTKISSVPLVHIANTETEPDIHPAFEEKNIPLIFSCDDTYAPYLTVCLQSVIAHTSADNNYDINVLVEKLNPQVKDTICAMQKPNVSIRFWSISSLLTHLDKKQFYLTDHFALSAYFRFFIPRLFRRYKKVLYLDCDMVILEDVAKLYQIELGEAYAGAVQDVGIYMHVYMDWFRKTGWSSYAKDVLQLKNPLDYFQSGVLIMDIKKLLDMDLEQKCLEALSYIKPRYVDQCILNHVLQGRVKQLPLVWNVEWHLPFWNQPKQELPAHLYTAWTEACRKPCILHYSSQVKPWYYVERPLSYYWWRYARQTPFYEQFVIRAAWQYMRRFTKLSGKNMCYSVFSKLTWGKKHKHYKGKKHQVRAELSQIKAFIRGRKQHA